MPLSMSGSVGDISTDATSPAMVTTSLITAEMRSEDSGIDAIL